MKQHAMGKHHHKKKLEYSLLICKLRKNQTGEAALRVVYVISTWGGWGRAVRWGQSKLGRPFF